MTSSARAKSGPSLRGAAFSPESRLGLLGNLPLPEKQIFGRELKIIRL